MANYIDEREGQAAFYRRFLPRVNPTLTEEEIETNFTDGLVNGNLVEFKLNLSDLNATLFQAIKYLSTLRLKGIPVPKNIIIVDLNSETAWVYDSGEYLEDIEKVYVGSASKNNSGFTGRNAKRKLDLKNPVDQETVVRLLKENQFTKINIDENCIIGWAEHFYSLNPAFSKGDFIGDKTGLHHAIGEIRSPYHLKDYILPYEGESNVRFEYLMDKLNDNLTQRSLGAYYTPEPYVEKSMELLRKAIARVPEGNDYIILDRCAGTGNLEKLLTDEELSHCVLSTKEYYEYKVLLEILGSKVRHLIPPIEEEDTYREGMVKGADALTQEYLDNPIIRQYIDNPKVTVILFENPPYTEPTAVENQRIGQTRRATGWKNSYVSQQMRQQVSGSALNDLANAFIWSGFQYYLRQPTDSYVLIAPPKYWKAQRLVNKRFLGGYAMNRKHFHATTESCTMCILWSNEDDQNLEEFELEGFNINKAGELEPYPKNLKVTPSYLQFSQQYYERTRPLENQGGGIVFGLNGLEYTGSERVTAVPLINDEIIGYLVAHSKGFDTPDLNSSLLSGMRYDAHGTFLYRDNYLEKLPMFSASRYVSLSDKPKWTEKGLVMKSADGWEQYERDVQAGRLDQVLLKNLLFCTLVQQNHMRSFHGRDGIFYQNQLSLDGTNFETQALKDLKRLQIGEKEQELLDLWAAIMEKAKQTANYNPELTYGPYQIEVELNTGHKERVGSREQTVYDYPELNSDLRTLKTKVRDYFNSEIAPFLFRYQFVK